MGHYSDFYPDPAEARLRDEKFHLGFKKYRLDGMYAAGRVCPTCSALVPDGLGYVEAHLAWHRGDS